VVSQANPAEVAAFFARQGARVVTLLGYSDAGYEDPRALLEHAERLLGAEEPQRTIVNIGGTAGGIGSVYEVAKRRGFTTTGIVSSQARELGLAISPWVDFVFFVPDPLWGGRVPGSERLSDTSQVIVDVSDLIVAIGGGEIARDELEAAMRAGKAVRFIAADMNHGIAQAAAARKNLPVPTDFRGAAGARFAGGLG
jgi:hypothetical protein